MRAFAIRTSPTSPRCEHLGNGKSAHLSQRILLLGWVTLVLFRTRRRDECSRLREGVRRRVRKSRQKEAAGAAGAGLMQIEWRERGWRSSLESKKPSEEKPAHLCEHGSRAEVSLGGDGKKIFGRDGGALRRGALKRADNAVCGRVISCSRG
jgi:hypothetical protein